MPELVAPPLPTTATLTVHVAPHGDDRYDGSPKQPLATLEAARDAVRARAPQGDAEIVVHGGSYFHDAPLRFDERDALPGGSSLTVRAATGETARLVGGRQVTGWERFEGEVWRARVQAGWTFHALFEDGVRAVPARWPKTGYLEVGQRAAETMLETPAGPVPSGEGRSSFVFNAGDLPRDADYSSAQVYMWPGAASWNWFSQTQPISRIDWDSRTVHVPHRAAWGIDQGSRYFVQHALALLTDPGEFYLDATQGWLYYRFRGDPARAEVIAPTVRRLLDVRGSAPEHPVARLNFVDLDLFATDFVARYDLPIGEGDDVPIVVGPDDLEHDGMVRLENAEHITLEGCRLRGAGLSAVVLRKHARHNRVTGNLIEDIGYNGVYLSGWYLGEGPFSNPRDAFVNRGNVVSNNRILNGGRLIGHGSGVMLVQSGDNTVTHNEIARMPRYGVSFKGLRFGVMRAEYYGQAVTWDNHWDFLHTRHNNVAFNHIHHVLEDTQDGAAIEAWAPGQHNRVHHNFVHDVRSPLPDGMTMGLYLDDASDFFEISHNVFTRVSGSRRFSTCGLIKGVHNVFDNNVFVNCDVEWGLVFEEVFGERNDHLRLTRNIFANVWRAQLWRFVGNHPEKLSQSDENLIWDARGEAPTVAGLMPDAADSIGDWTAWRANAGGRFDGCSVVADPRFVDAEHDDYRFTPDSPAHALGIVGIDVRRCGPDEHFPFDLEGERR
jgi:hypothetical protein